jgi:hypothetical protein
LQKFILGLALARRLVAQLKNWTSPQQTSESKEICPDMH